MQSEAGLVNFFLRVNRQRVTTDIVNQSGGPLYGSFGAVRHGGRSARWAFGTAGSAELNVAEAQRLSNSLA